MKGIVVTNDGVSVQEFADETSLRLAQMQFITEGYIQIVPMPDGSEIIVNEEGKLRGLDINWPATRYAADQPEPALLPGDYIAGDAIITGGADNDGNTVSAPQSALDYFGL